MSSLEEHIVHFIDVLEEAMRPSLIYEYQEMRVITDDTKYI